MKLLSLAMVAVASIALAQEPKVAAAELKDANGTVVGRVRLVEPPVGGMTAVMVVATITGLPAGTHGFHIHETGSCEAPFASAGGHFNPDGKQHGMINPLGMHAGDLTNITVPADGKLTVEIIARGVTLSPGTASLLKPGGTALVVHAMPDDYETGPSGNAGARIACGVIVAK